MSFGLAPVRGTVAVRRGTIDIADPVGRSSVHAELDAASFHTGNRQRDHDLRSARFLDTDRYSTVTFQSTRLEAAGGVPRLLGTAPPGPMRPVRCWSAPAPRSTGTTSA
jgi:polyisoprenoid-binding protein YceI